MTYLKRILMVCAGLYLGGVLSYGQTPVRTITALSKGALKESLSYQLYRRAHESWVKAYRLRSLYPRTNTWDWPATRTSSLLTLPPQQLYPRAEFLQTPEELTNYFLTRNNLEIRKWLPRTYARNAFLQTHAQDFISARQPVTHPAEHDMTWLVNQIPAQTNYLLLGERHHFADIQQQIANLLPQLRQKFSQEIFLFTEFIPQDKSWTVALDYDEMAYYLPIYLSAQTENISVIGLEPPFVHKTDVALISQETLVLPPSLQITQDVWQSLEGLRLRNEQWLRVLQQYREEHPDALFIIHAGYDHVGYAAPYSLGAQLRAQGSVFVASFAPLAATTHAGTTLLTSEFDQATDGLLPDRVLLFDTPELIRQAGFDVQIKIPVTGGHP